MKIYIKFYSGFEKYLKKRSNQEISLHVHPGEDIKLIIHRFLPEDIVGFVGVVLVNKKISNLDYKVKDGDMIEVFPMIGGG